MQFTFEKKQRRRLYLSFTLIFLICAVFVYGTYFLTGHELIWHLDGANQHLPLMQKYRQILKDFLTDPTKPFEQWSWHMGLGTDTFSVYSYYLIGDVFAYLTLLFPAGKMVFAYQFLIILRLYCAGLSFVFFVSHFKDLKDHAILCGSLVYLFNAYLLYSNVAQPFFTLPFIIFPLIITAIEKVLQDGSFWPLYLVFSWMLISNFYFAYVMGLGAMVYLALRWFISYRKSGKVFGKLCKLASATLFSLLTSAFMLIPEIYAVMHSTRSASAFANGLKVYPLYYYLALPSQLINGGNRDFYFWSALGFCSLAFFAIIYILAKRRKYPVLATLFGFSFVMLLIPACGAFFNGMMSPSNRWTLMLCLPVGLASAILVQNITQLSKKMLKLFTIALVAYLAVITSTYYFQNNERIFIPIIFLAIFWAVIYVINTADIKSGSLVMLFVSLGNVCLNAVYFEAPFNGGYSNEMLDSGAYVRLSENRYAGLEQDLDEKNDFYRVSTLSQNYFFGSDYHMYNALNDKLYSLNSYYSLQNKDLGNFSTLMQNTQYESNIPLGQVSDRTILNDFFGVRYLFVRINQPNADKIPAGFVLDKTTRRITDPNGNSKLDSQTQRYKNECAFPLVYWQDKVLTQKDTENLSISAKERALADGVYVSEKNASGLSHADISNKSFDVPYTLVSSRGNVVSALDFEKRDKNETYRIILQNPEEYQNCELHVEINDINYVPYSLKKQVSIEQRAKDNDPEQGILAQNKSLNYYRYLRYHVLQGSPNISYALKVDGPYGTEKISQPDQSALSFFKKVTNGTLNLGYFPKQLPDSLTLSPTKLGNYGFELRVTATPLSGDYRAQVKKLQRHALLNVKFSRNMLSGSIKTSRDGILASSIPYSKGWSATVNGRKAKVIKTNHAFVGLRLSSGKSDVVLKYRIPGLRQGLLITKLSLVFVLALALCDYLRLKKRK